MGGILNLSIPFSGSAGGGGSGGVAWTITASADGYGPHDVSITSYASGTPTAPNSWKLVGPGEVDESSKLSGTGTHTVTAQITDAGPWRFEAYDATLVVLAISVQTVVYRAMGYPIVDEPVAETLG